MKKYYIVDYDTDLIIDELFQRPSKEWMEERAKKHNPAGCSLYVVTGEKDSRLSTSHEPMGEEGSNG